MSKDNLDNKWSQPVKPPSPLFIGQKEKNLVKQINDELIERVVGQQVLYYPISLDHTNFHSLYGEAIKKTFLPAVRVYALINWEGHQTSTTNYGLDRLSSVTINFHKRRLTEDQDLFVREGDFVLVDKFFYEILSLTEPRWLFGQADTRFEIVAICNRARKGLFDAT